MHELQTLLNKINETYPKGSDSSQVITVGELKRFLVEIIDEDDEREQRFQDSVADLEF